MKKVKILFILIIAFVITSCSIIQSPVHKDNVSNIILPQKDLALSGIWIKTEEYSLEKPKITYTENNEEIFLSKSVLDIDKNYTLNPNITSRFVNFGTYMATKISEIPADFGYLLETATVVEFSNNISFSQEFVKLDDNKLLTIKLGKILIYEKKEEIEQTIEETKFFEVQALIRGGDKYTQKDFGLAISFRKRDTSILDQIDYHYYTYFLKRTKEDEKAKILKVNDIIVPKTSGLWRIDTSINESAGEFTNYSISANPITLDDGEQVNIISDNIYRRIDFVNNDYIAVTNLDYLTDSISQTYNIFNMANLANKEPLKVNNIAGNVGNEVYQTRYKEQANVLLNRNDVDSVSSTPDTRNIGLKRIGNGWHFVSNINVETQDSSQEIVSEFDVNINPVVNLANNDNKIFSWREILSRRPGAIDATISPDNNYILIQTTNSLEFYRIYSNFIGNDPLFTIQNVQGYDIVMTNWISQDSIDNVFNEYDKMKKLNSYIIYP